MLKPVPLANALAVITAAFYLICWVIFQVAPEVYNFLINSYSFGADVAGIFQPPHTFGSLLIALIVSSATAWAAGYTFAWLYNKWSK